jgi:hypothetical protein
MPDDEASTRPVKTGLRDTNVVRAWMGLFNNPAGMFDLGVLPTLWTLTAPAYILGGLLLAIATLRAAILPRGAAVLLAAGLVVPSLCGKKNAVVSPVGRRR